MFQAFRLAQESTPAWYTTGCGGTTVPVAPAASSVSDSPFARIAATFACFLCMESMGKTQKTRFWVVFRSRKELVCKRMLHVGGAHATVGNR